MLKYDILQLLLQRSRSRKYVGNKMDFFSLRRPPTFGVILGGTSTARLYIKTNFFCQKSRNNLKNIGNIQNVAEEQKRHFLSEYSGFYFVHLALFVQKLFWGASFSIALTLH
jgi:hypothetical protein